MADLPIPMDPETEDEWGQTLNEWLTTEHNPDGTHSLAVADIQGLPGELDGKADAEHTHTMADVTDLPAFGTAATADTGDFASAAQGETADTAVQPGDLADVATSGDYADLVNTPTIPAIPDALTDLDTTVTGPQLDSLKNKVDGIAAGAEVNAVDSVNGETGAVVLDAGDVGAAEASHTHDIDDLNATGTPGSGTYLRGDGAWATPPTGGGGGAVDSVNGQTGDVTLDADDIDDASTAHKFASAAELSKLSGIEAGAEVNEVTATDIADFETTTELNARDTANRDRANHTGTQAISTVSGLQDAINSKANDADVVKTATAQTITGRKTFAPANSEPIIAANSAPALSGWTLTGTATYSAPNIVITSGAASISYSATVVAGRAYQFDVTSTGDAGQYTISVGSVSMTLPASEKTFALIASDSGSQTIKLEGTTWAATISALTVREVQLASPAIIANIGEIRAYGTNTAIGQDSLSSNTTGSENTAAGYAALINNTTGSYNTAAGWSALQNNTTGNSNTATGYLALASNTTGSDTTATGYLALTSNTTGVGNTAAGHAALQSNTTGSRNTAAGRSALTNNTTGSDNTAAGHAALGNNTTGSDNTAAGRNALYLNTIGSFNTAVGRNALQSNNTGGSNTAIGRAALNNNAGGSHNTAIGRDSGPAGGSVDRGTSLGYQAKANHDRSVALGADTETTATDQVMVGDRDIEITSTTRGVILRSPNGTRYRLTVGDDGTLGTTTV